MAKLVEAVRGSPLIRKRHAGGYAVLESEARDPFVQGVSFHAHFVGSAEVETKQDSPDVQTKVKEIWDEGERKKSLCKVVITVRSTSVRVRDVASKYEDNYPIYLVSYCGAANDVNLAFYFIHKSRLDRVLRVEVFKMATKEKLKAITLTLAKAFNIAFKAWMSEKRRKEKAEHRNGGSPTSLPKGGKGHLAKMAPGVAGNKGSGPYTPPAPRKTDDGPKLQRRGSLGDEPGGSGAAEGANGGIPAVRRLQTSNELTGSRHDILITEDYDHGFQELVDAAPHSPTPEVLPTNLLEQVDAFDLKDIKQHIDSEDPDQ